MSRPWSWRSAKSDVRTRSVTSVGIDASSARTTSGATAPVPRSSPLARARSMTSRTDSRGTSRRLDSISLFSSPPTATTCSKRWHVSLTPRGVLGAVHHRPAHVGGNVIVGSFLREDVQDEVDEYRMPGRQALHI